MVGDLILVRGSLILAKSATSAATFDNLGYYASTAKDEEEVITQFQCYIIFKFQKSNDLAALLIQIPLILLTPVTNEISITY